MKKTSQWHLNKFRGNFETYEDTYRYISERTIVSENLSTPADKVRQNYDLLKYRDQQQRAEDKEQARISATEAVLSLVLVVLTFSLIAIILSNSK